MRISITDYASTYRERLESSLRIPDVDACLDRCWVTFLCNTPRGLHMLRAHPVSRCHMQWAGIDKVDSYASKI